MDGTSNVAAVGNDQSGYEVSVHVRSLQVDHLCCERHVVLRGCGLKPVGNSSEVLMQRCLKFDARVHWEFKG